MLTLVLRMGYGRRWYTNDQVAVKVPLPTASIEVLPLTHSRSDGIPLTLLEPERYKIR